MTCLVQDSDGYLSDGYLFGTGLVTTSDSDSLYCL